MFPASPVTTISAYREPNIICMVDTSTLGCDQVRGAIRDRLREFHDLAVVEADIFPEGDQDERFFRCSLRARIPGRGDVTASFSAGRARSALEGALMRLRSNLLVSRKVGDDRRPDHRPDPARLSLGA